jgi:hypothetical protein
MIFRCIGCNKEPHEIPEYIEAASDNDMTPEQYVISEEGTLNRENGHFACTSCYIQMGMPASPRGWVAP